ncbi:hypothetical protein [Streptomyces sp. NPDC050564]|uniref:hypothetical protein n=1 Tax=Streptomyces sp. NPDC050564 TaxID=3365631 RepID=UPI0037924753
MQFVDGAEQSRLPGGPDRVVGCADRGEGDLFRGETGRLRVRRHTAQSAWHLTPLGDDLVTAMRPLLDWSRVRAERE